MENSEYEKEHEKSGLLNELKTEVVIFEIIGTLS
jgi:hypothetical protein